MHDDLSPLSQDLFFNSTMRPKVNIVQPKPNNPTVKQRHMHITCANASKSSPPLFLIFYNSKSSLAGATENIVQRNKVDAKRAAGQSDAKRIFIFPREMPAKKRRKGGDGRTAPEKKNLVSFGDFHRRCKRRL